MTTEAQRTTLAILADVLPEDAYLAGGLADLTAMKVHAIASRGAARDFWDLHVLIRERGISLAKAIAEHSKRYPRENPGHVLRSLAYFGDADAAPLPRGLDETSWRRIRADFESWVRQT